MKKTILFLLGLLPFLYLQAQIPEMFTYQAIARHGSAPGEIISNQTLTIRLSLKEGSESGAIIWEEEHSVQTNEYGLFACRIGDFQATRIQGSAQNFSDIPWGNGNLYLETSVFFQDSWHILGGAPLLSVPYALYAKNAMNIDDADADPENEKISQAVLSGTNLEITESGHTWIIDVSSLLNTDSQGISLDNNTLTLENGGSVDLSSFLDNPFSISGDTLYKVNGSLALGSVSPGNSKLSVTGNDVLDDEALFEVKRKDGQTVFAVYNTGVRINLPEDTLMTPTKGRKGGFAIGGFSDAKDYSREYMRITPDSVRFWLKQDPQQKGRKGGFAIGGFSDAKNPSYEYLRITHDSTRIYINDNPDQTKGRKGGFAIGGFSDAKTNIMTDEYLRISRDSSRVYINDNAGETKGRKGGFAIGGFSDAKAPSRAFLRVTDDSTRVYIKEGDAKGRKGGFAIGGFNDAKGEEFEYFNVSGLSSVDTVANASQLLWYPQKEALLAGRVHIGSADSVGTNSTALGYKSVAMGNWSQAFGYKSIATGDYSTAIGKNAVAGNSAFAFGEGSSATGSAATAIGKQAVASHTNSFALGEGAQALSEESYALGRGAKAEGYRSFAFGSAGIDTTGAATQPATANGAYSFSMGQGSYTEGQGSFALGLKAQALEDFAVALGTYSVAEGRNSLALGFGNYTGSSYATAVGFDASTTGMYSSSFGYKAITEGHYSLSMGYESRTTENHAVSIGSYAMAKGEKSVAIGWNSLANSFKNIAIGNLAQAKGYQSVAIGQYTYAKDYEFVVGAMNDTTVTNAAFVVGIGSFPTTYKNGMIISTTGNVEFPSATSLKIGNMPNLLSLEANGGVAVYNSNPYFMLDGSSNRWTIQNNGGSLQFLEKTGSTDNLELSLDNDGNMVVEGTGTYVNSLIVKAGNSETGNTVASLYNGGGAFNSTGGVSLSHNGSQKVNIYSNGDSYLNGGDVGIGLTNPTEKLYVYDSETSLGVITAVSASTGINATAGHFYATQSTNGVGVIAKGNLYDFYAEGAGANYGPFTGSHEVVLEKNTNQDLKPGMIVSSTGITHLRKDKNGLPSLSSTMPEVRLASHSRDKAVLGVLVSTAILNESHWFKDKEGRTFATVNALGEGRVWVCNANGDIEAGDYITTSSPPGYGQKQEDDLLHNYTLGKAIETINWEEVTDTITYNGKTYKVYLLAVVYTSG